MRISDWSSDVCSSDLLQPALEHVTPDAEHHGKADDDQKEGDHVAVHWSFSSVRGATQPLDLLIEQVAAVGDDAFDGREPVFHRATLGPQLRVLLAQQLGSATGRERVGSYG